MSEWHARGRWRAWQLFGKSCERLERTVGRRGPESRSVGTLHPRIGASFALIPITIGVEFFLYYSMSIASKPSFGVGMVYLMGLAPTIVFYGGSLLIWCPVVDWTPAKIRRTVYTSVALGLFV